MSVEQPSSGRPTGPPSGPLSGPSQPPAGPPTQPPADRGGGSHGGDGGEGGGPGTGPGPEPHPPWWRSVPRVAVLVTAVMAAVVLIVVLTRPDGTSDQAAGGEVFLQAADRSGPDPFTESTAKDSSAPPLTPPTATGSETVATNTVRRVDGDAAGLYGGTRKVASCDVEKQIRVLGAAPAKNGAFASVLGLRPAGVPAYLRSLTPVQLRMDTRVTNHGYRDAAATNYQAVLQTGTAVLVDDRGRPRVRCACGNPLTDPVRQRTVPSPAGDTWPAYRSSNVVVVAPATTVINVFVVYDPDRGDWFHRHHGDTGRHDQKTEPPSEPPTGPPTPSVSSPTPSEPSAESSEPTSEAPGLVPPQSPLPCVSAPTGSASPPASPASPAAPGTASPSAKPCPPTSSPPSSAPPAVQPPSSALGSPQSPPDGGGSDATPESAFAPSSS
ncbi:DUF6777 domain-containing protein [Streptomyces sp. WI04-05B]|uniref:DUF6777 domain-containing protein n=1 Tax=Streptomyces TaxID=1883 RepID=UPI0029A4AAB9|nr:MULTISPECIES: DUF6777 domain-containing protein [unclassified Streptomyces]MDX2541522.1 hypothetical protein [Streptomyces sp. WI04-05B]MDX2583744.1 hypothetical protein [Streptomyces sp. WI04-05A]MDX3745529.1 hypothetical protein [Streptomyces sp. AK08-02]